MPERWEFAGSGSDDDDTAATFLEEQAERDVRGGGGLGRGTLLPALERLLLAMAARNSVVGYCQGMNFVGAILLLVMGDEEAAFWLACAFVEDLVPPNFHAESLCGAEVEVSAQAIHHCLRFIPGSSPLTLTDRL